MLIKLNHIIVPNSFTLPTFVWSNSYDSPPFLRPFNSLGVRGRDCFSPPIVNTRLLRTQRTHAWLTNVYGREKKVLTALQYASIWHVFQSPNIWPTPTTPSVVKPPYQSSVNSASFSCRLIIPLFWANPPRFYYDWGGGGDAGPMLRYNNKQIFFFSYFSSSLSRSLLRIEGFFLKKNNKTTVS